MMPLVHPAEETVQVKRGSLATLRLLWLGVATPFLQTDDV